MAQCIEGKDGRSQGTAGGRSVIGQKGPGYRAMDIMANEKGSSPPGGRPRAGADGALGANSEIARKLGDYFRGLESEQVPDRLLQLLDQLDEAETRQKKD